MESPAKEFRMICKKYLSPLGFIGRPGFQYRIVNDLMQSVYLTRFRGGGFEIEFGITPLCAGIAEIDVTYTGSRILLGHCVKGIDLSLGGDGFTEYCVKNYLVL